MKEAMAMAGRLKGLIIVGAALAFAAGAVYGEVGSIISSFKVSVSYPPQMTVGVYRDESYVYVVIYDYGEYFYMYRYTPDGTRTGGVDFGELPFGPGQLPDGADHSVLGAGYIAITFGNGFLLTYTTSTGQMVESVQYEPRFNHYAFIPGGRCIYVGVGYDTYRVTRSWSIVNSFAADGAIHAATEDFNGGHGQYILTESGSTSTAHTLVYTGDGSLVSSFPVIYSGKDSTCGPGYPASYGVTYWRFVKSDPDFGWCYQIDLCGAVSVQPTSVGKVKALFR
jgi:hypothetical protein